MSYSEFVSINTVELERMEYALNHAISQEIIKDIANPLRTKMYLDHIARQFVFQIRMDVLSEKIGKETITHPAGWFEWWKQSFYEWLSWPGGGHMPWLGDYLKKKYPVVITTHVIEARAFYPNISIPENQHFVRIARMGAIEW